MHRSTCLCRLFETPLPLFPRHAALATLSWRVAAGLQVNHEFTVIGSVLYSLSLSHCAKAQEVVGLLLRGGLEVLSFVPSYASEWRHRFSWLIG